ncbi:VOC family protein [Thalassobium sp. R2A62]|jgi:predicted lactoylglutathione lyase|uniref:VOC family protein n=1 Tax=Thalassobium sp. R2A62 TaxID=633131 RepID=UPI0001B1D762|nr:VOC family protein [Thalassobium sp. R2A62]EET49329.1 glyoxalase/bleomycin resistance protein/dioxygenase [Thalassobium sp. R2A62]MDG1341037.1 VOC family protein [Paracoccaceae bacterium]MDG1801448.1 VOC family protein [Paracoccaceae bacterium]MDG2453448.1 VOC family protein [Paracoccaceae bacterium]
MKANRMSLITLGVSNIAASRAYYEALGWTPEEALENVIFYDMGGMKFGLFPLEVLAVEQKRPVTELGLGATTIAQNYNSAAEVDAAFAAALAAGATAVAQPNAMDWGGYSSYVADPDGHIWEFAFNPFWPLDEDGKIA